MSYIWHEYNLSYLKYAYFNISNKTNFCLGSGRDEIYLSRPTFWFKILACVLNDVNWKQLLWFEKSVFDQEDRSGCIQCYKYISVLGLPQISTAQICPFIYCLHHKYCPHTYPENLNLLNIPPLQLSSCTWYMIHNVSISKVRHFSR